jgi:4-amino-4-deoxy-L-arabinose transferase-like glycosyltransferase
MALKRLWRDPWCAWFPVVMLTGLAALLRFSALAALPPGLYRDEAYNGLDALGVLQGHIPLFFEANNGREPLYIYLLAASVALLGPSPGALRLVSAVLGTLTVPATYLLGRELFNRRAGMIAAALVATTVWPLNLSRLALRVVSMPLLLAVAVALCWRGMERRRPGLLAGAGLVYGLTFYTYLAARFTILIWLFYILYLALRREKLWPLGWLVFGLVSLAVAAPLGLYFLRHWDVTLARAGQVSLWNPAINGGDPWGMLFRHMVYTAQSFFYRGDFIPRHNIPLRPSFDPWMALAFAGGLGLALGKARRSPAHGLVLIWLGVMVWPTILAEGAPHFLRAAGILPALFLFPALGLQAAAEWLARKGWGKLAWLAVGGVLVWSAAHNVFPYAQHLQSEAVYYNFESAATQLATEINAFLGTGWRGTGLAVKPTEPWPGRRVYLAARLWRDWPAVRYLCSAAERLFILPAEGLPEERPSATEEILLCLWPYEDNRAALALLPPGRLISAQEGAQERGDLERESRLLYVTLRATADEVPSRQTLGTWEGGLRLVGYRLEHIAPQRVRVELFWQTDRPLAANYTIFCHVARGGQLLGQHDGPAAGGYYPTDVWRVGDTVRDAHTVELTAPLNAAEDQVMVGLYLWETMEHLRLLDASGRPTAQTRLALRP